MKKYYQYYKYIPILQIFQLLKHWKLEIGSIGNSRRRREGQTLVSLMIFMVTAIIIITAAVAVIIINSKATSKFYQGIVSYDIAETGIENAIIRLLRDPNYSGETLVLEDKTVEIQVSGASPYTIISTGTNGNFKRTIQATASYNNNVLNISSWEEQ